MQNNVQEMTDDSLLRRMRECLTQHEYEAEQAELARRLSVMRELCEAYCHRSEVEGRYHEGEATGVDLHNAWERLQAGAEDYRAMKGEKYV